MIGARPLEAAAAYAIGTLISKGRDNVPMASPQLKARTARRVELCLLAIVLLAFGVVIVICGTSAEAADLVGNGAYTNQAPVPWLLGDWDGARLRLREMSEWILSSAMLVKPPAMQQAAFTVRSPMPTNGLPV